MDRKVFATNLPLNHARDVESIIKKLKGISQLKDAKILLLGWSEGTIIAPIVAEKKDVEVDGLFLAGYVNDTIPEIVKWQLAGGSSMVFYRKYFDKDKDGRISPAEYNGGPEEIIKNILKGAKFKQIDLNKDGFLTAEDFKIMLSNRYHQVIGAFERGDDDWIWNNYFEISTAWYKAHAELAPNRERLLSLDLPIYIFQGTDDQNTPVEGTYDIERRFRRAGKDNLHVYIFKGHDHDLNYLNWPLKGSLSKGLNSLFSSVEEFVESAEN